MQERREAGKEGCMKRGIQERREAGIRFQNIKKIFKENIFLTLLNLFLLSHTFWKPTSRDFSGRNLLFAISCAVLRHLQTCFLFGELKFCTFEAI